MGYLVNPKISSYRCIQFIDLLERMVNQGWPCVQAWYAFGYLPAGVCSGNANWSYFHLQITWFYSGLLLPTLSSLIWDPIFINHFTVYKALWRVFSLGYSSHQYDARIAWVFFTKKSGGEFFSSKFLPYQSHFKRCTNDNLIILTLKMLANSYVETDEIISVFKIWG